MPGTVRANLGLTEGFSAGEDGWDGADRGNLRRLDSLVMLSVKDKDLNAPPGGPADGDRYIVGPSPSGAWASKAAQVATWNSVSAAWDFYVPKKGWRAYVEDEFLPYRYEAAWAVEQGTLDVRSFGAKGDGVTDDTAAINLAIATAPAGSSVRIPGPGPYLVLALAGKHGVSIESDGATLKKNGGGLDTHILNLTGSLSATSEGLTANAAVGDTVLTVADSAGFAAGDFVLVRDATYKYGTTGRNQELNRVQSVTATTITLRNRLVGSYATASTAEVYKLNPMGDLTIRGLRFEVQIGSNTGGGLYGTLCYNVRVVDCQGLYPNDDGGFYFNQSAHCEVVGGGVRDGQNSGSGSYGYGVIFDECQFCFARGVHTENVRENTMTNNTRFSGFDRCVDVGANDGSFNTHGSGCASCSIHGCTSVSAKASAISVGWSGHNAPDVDISVLDNVIVNPRSHGISVASPSGSRNQRVLVKGNTIRGFGAAEIAAFGVFVGESDHVEVLGNIISGGGANAAYGVRADGSKWLKVEQNEISDLSNGYGVGILDGAAPSDHVSVKRNRMTGISSSNVRCLGAGTNVTIEDNETDDDLFTLLATDQARPFRRVTSPAFAASFTPNAMSAETVQLGALTANLTVNAPTNPTTGARLTFRILQDGTGGRTVSWNAAFIHAWSDAGNTANKASTVTFYFDGTSWRQVGAQSPYA